MKIILESAYKFILVFILITASTSVLSEVKLKPFTSGSYSKIVSIRSKPFILIFWSLDCPSCYKELEMLSRFNNRHKKLDIILVSTDIEANLEELVTILTKYKLDNVESWVFRGSSDERLRFEIDAQWYGELPRSYLFKGKNKKQVISGVLSEEKLLSWFK